MANDVFSAWDRYPWLGEHGYHIGDLLPGENWKEARRRLRTQAFEVAARGVSDAELMDTDSRWAPAKLLLVHRERVSYWRQKLEHAEPGLVKGVVFCIALLLLIIMLAFVYFGLRRFPATWGIAVFIPVPAAFIVSVMLQEHRRRRLIRQMQDACCSKCGYALGDKMLGNVIRPPEWTPIGPRRCPECGVHWPMVTPPTSFEEHMTSVRADELR